MGRVISLSDEIKMHLTLWIADEEFDKLSLDLKNALIASNNSLRIKQALIKCGDGEDNNEQKGIVRQKKEFIAIFKQKYIQNIDMSYDKPMNIVTNSLLIKTIERLLSQGSNSQEYLDWVWDDFFSLQRNKKYLPADIAFVCSSWIVDKFLYEKKDSLRIRKRDIVDLAIKNKIIELATRLLEEIKERNLGEKILSYSRGDMTIKQFVESMKKYCEKHDKKDFLEQLKKIKEK